MTRLNVERMWAKEEAADAEARNSARMSLAEEVEDILREWERVRMEPAEAEIRRKMTLHLRLMMQRREREATR